MDLQLTRLMYTRYGIIYVSDQVIHMDFYRKMMHCGRLGKPALGLVLNNYHLGIL